jgi:hypothetical protein
MFGLLEGGGGSQREEVINPGVDQLDDMNSPLPLK